MLAYSSTISWNVTPCKLSTFQRKVLPQSSGSGSKPTKKQSNLVLFLDACLLFFDPKNGGTTFLRNVIALLHGVIFQEIVVFIVTGVRTSLFNEHNRILIYTTEI
jgi:hypothetical protein